MTWATPPNMPPSCRNVVRTMAAHIQTTQLTPRRRGPGTWFRASRPVSPVATV